MADTAGDREGERIAKVKETVDLDAVLRDAREHMEKSLDSLHRELGAIRTGRANPALLDRLMVAYYGTPTPLNAIAGVSSPDPRQLLISPYDKSSIPDIEKAIQKSDLGLTPGNDGQVIRITIPPLTEERRKEFVKLVHGRAEDTRVAVRNVRRDHMELLRRKEKDGALSSDELAGALAAVQKITDTFVARIDDIAQRKEAEILEV